VFAFAILYLVLLLIRPQEYVPALLDVPLMPAMLIAALAQWVLSRDKDLGQPQYLLLAGFLFAIMGSLVVNGWPGGAMVQLASFGPAVAAFVLMANAANTPRRVAIAFWTLVLSSLVLVLHGIQQVRVGVGWTGVALSPQGRIQYIGTLNDPNDLGLLFVVALPLALYLSRNSRWLGRWLGLAGAGLLLYGIYLTDSRGAMLATAAMAAAYAYVRHGALGATAILGLGLLVNAYLPSRLQGLELGESSAMGRVDSWYEGLQMFLSQPILGVGAQNFTEYNALTAHNSFVLVLAETGLVGYALWLSFVGYTFRMMLTMLRYQPDPASDGSDAALRWRDERGLAFAMLISLVGFFAAAFFLSRSYQSLLYLLVAICVGHFSGARTRFPALGSPYRAGDWWRWPLLAAGSVVLLYLLVRVLLTRL
jgi:O-antigen ligase